MINKYKLILNKDTFLWINNNEGLIYQSKSAKAFVFFLSDALLKICNDLLEIDNLYTVELTEKELTDNHIRHFVSQLVDIDAGDLLPNTETIVGAVSIIPILRVQKNINYYISLNELGVGGSIIQHIHELTFYINGSEFGNDMYYKQTLFPRKDELILKKEKIIHFISNSRNYFLSCINIVGNIFTYPEYNELLSCIIAFGVSVTIYTTVSDFLINEKLLKDLGYYKKIQFNILIDREVDINQLIIILDKINIPYLTTFLVFSEQNYFDFEKEATLMNGNIIPVFNNNNIGFFKSHVFFDQEDIILTALTKREVFMRQVVNTHSFGKLTILPNSTVYADVNQAPLGTLDDTVYSIVYKEFTEGNSWFRIRNQTPCNSCVYQWLCPSPSDYEIAIGRPNLCHVST